jgi:hypothetical protein
LISELYRRHRAVEFKKFLTATCNAVPDELDVHLVCDNHAMTRENSPSTSRRVAAAPVDSIANRSGNFVIQLAGLPIQTPSLRWGVVSTG